MKKNEAEKLVNDTFTQPYDEDRFRIFVHNLFHAYERLNEQANAGCYIPESFQNTIVSYKRLAKFNDPEGMEIDVLAVKLHSRRTLENARTTQRNFIARYLNGSRGGALKDAALVAFYADDCDDWRFSLVRMDYKLNEEKQKVEKKLTPARRYSFLVGQNEGTHTARRQLMPILQVKTETTLAELEDAFNIETVTKEFFEQYKALYLRLKDALDAHLKKDPVTKKEFTARHIGTPDFAKRLLGQVVFLYFLQKKGWLGVEKGKEWGTGPKNFMQKLYAEGQYDNFFNDVLEHLFYDALATERQTQDHFYAPLGCKIPFLNGGLFEPFKGYSWDNTDILLDNAIFSEIFEVLDLYNFTVREDEPLDKEVAVDPEMLGKVFENLIPENERKGSGTYYTPREIVHYMCQESLINYLDAKLNIKSQPVQKQGQQALLSDTVEIDLLTEYEDTYVPLVPRDDLAEFIYHGDVVQEHEATAQTKNANGDYKGDYRHKIPVSVREHVREIDDALASVKICDPAIGSGAFPVGVMNEIVRARSALNAYLGDQDRTPYDFKRHAIQESIYGVDIEPSAVDIAKLRLWLSLVVDEEDFGTIKPLPNLEYKIMAGDSLLGIDSKGDLIRSQQLRELERLKEEYFPATSPSRKAEIKKHIEAIISDLTSTHTRAEGLQQNSRFDYHVFFSEVFSEKNGFDIAIANPPYVDSETMVKTNKSYRERVKNRFSSASGNWDLFVVFIELGIHLLNRRGSLEYITPNKLIGAKYAEEIRKIIARNSVIEIRDYSRINVFDTADVYPVVTGLTKHPSLKPMNLTTMETLTSPRFSMKIEPDLFRKDALWDKYFGDPKHVVLLSKLQMNKPLSFFINGSICGAATVSEAYQIKEYLADGEIGNESIKLINTGTIDPYYSAWGISDTQYIKRKYKRPYITEENLRTISSTRLLQAKSPKIIVAGMSKAFEAFLDKDGDYLAGKSTSIIIDNSITKLSAICALLNSKLLSYWLQKNFHSLKMAGGYINVGVKELEIVPVPDKLDNFENELSALVDRISKDKLEGNNSNLVSTKIDQLVYKLYGLGSEEIAIVEEAAS